MNSNTYDLVSIILIAINILTTGIISFIGFSKTNKIQKLVEIEATKREIFQREYDIRKNSIKNSEEKSALLFKYINHIIELLKGKKTNEADVFMMVEANSFYWKNILFIPNDLQEIYVQIIDLSIDAAITYSESIKVSTRNI